MRLHAQLLPILFVVFSAHPASSADPNALLARADHFAELGNSIKAEPLYAEAEKEFQARGDARKELYAKFGRLRHQIETGSYLTAAREVERDLGNPIVQNDPALKLRALALKGTIDLNLNTAAAQEDFSQMAATAKSIGEKKWENRAAGELGIVAGVNGDVGAAGMALLKAISTAGALHDVSSEISFSTWLANGMTVNGMPDKAIAAIDRAFSLIPKDPQAGFPVQLYIAKIRALVSLPATDQARGSAEAKQLIEVALKYARENNILGAQCELLNQAGLLAMEVHETANAEKYFQQTVAVATQADLPRMEAEGDLHLAEIYEQQRELDKALAAIDSGIGQMRLVEEGFDLPVFVARKAEIEADRGNLRRADQLYDQASDLIEAMLINAPSSHVKSSMIAALSDIYVGHFRLALDQFHDPRRAFHVIETARGRALADSMRYASGSSGVSKSSSQEQQIAAIQARLRQQPTTPDETKALLARLDQTYDQLAPVEYKRSRAEMSMARRPPVSLGALQKSLAPGEVVIEYVLDDRQNSNVLEISSKEIRPHRIPPKSEIGNLCQKLVHSIKAKENSSQFARALLEKAVLPAISTNPSALIIIPDGPLNLVPFAALGDKDGEYLARSLVISLAPSATVFEMLRTARRDVEPPRPFLGVAYSPGGSAGKDNKPYVASRGLETGFAQLKPLLFARDEIESAARIAGAGSVLLSDDKATESELKAEPLQDFKIMHFALHGFGNMTEPDRAGLVLAPGDPNEDGLWQAREIRESRVAADLVTLSACETGVGRLQGEEGIMNLARTFLIAGAKSVMSSLWDADDRSTATLMKHFYEQIATGKTVSEALREAQMTMLKEFGSDLKPYYWAGFTVIGDGRTQIRFSKAKPSIETTARLNIR